MLPSELQPPTSPGRDPADRQSRRVLTIFTGLLVLGLLTAALWPAGGARPVAEPSSPVGALPAPPAETPPAVAEPLPAPAPPAALPDLPDGDPARLVVYGDRACPQIALTYDAGSGADGAAAIVDVLKKHGVTSTFFLTGKWVERYPDLAKRIAAEGHEIANHTYSHPDLTKLTPQEVIQQVQDGEAAIRRITGKETKPLFREPYGAFNETELRLIRQAGFSYSIYWEVDTLDWQFPPVQTLVNRITQKSKNGSIVLMHLNVPDTAIASDQAIAQLREKGFKLVTVTQVMQCQSPKPPSVDGPILRNGRVRAALCGMGHLLNSSGRRFSGF